MFKMNYTFNGFKSLNSLIYIYIIKYGDNFYFSSPHHYYKARWV